MTPGRAILISTEYANLHLYRLGRLPDRGALEPTILARLPAKTARELRDHFGTAEKPGPVALCLAHELYRPEVSASEKSMSALQELCRGAAVRNHPTHVHNQWFARWKEERSVSKIAKNVGSAALVTTQLETEARFDERRALLLGRLLASEEEKGTSDRTPSARQLEWAEAHGMESSDALLLARAPSIERYIEILKRAAPISAEAQVQFGKWIRSYVEDSTASPRCRRAAVALMRAALTGAVSTQPAGYRQASRFALAYQDELRRAELDACHAPEPERPSILGLLDRYQLEPTNSRVRDRIFDALSQDLYLPSNTPLTEEYAHAITRFMATERRDPRWTATIVRWLRCSEYDSPRPLALRLVADAPEFADRQAVLDALAASWPKSYPLDAVEAYQSLGLVAPRIEDSLRQRVADRAFGPHIDTVAMVTLLQRPAPSAESLACVRDAYLCYRRWGDYLAVGQDIHKRLAQHGVEVPPPV